MLRNSSSHAHRAGGASCVALIAAAGLFVMAALPAQAQNLRGSFSPGGGEASTGALLPLVQGATPGEAAAEADPAPSNNAPAPARAPSTDDVTTATVRETTVDEADEERNIAAKRESLPAPPIEGRTLPAEENPFAPTGIRVGSFVIRPTLQQGIEYTTNAAGLAGGGSDVLSETTLRLNAQSDWSRHSATLDAFGTYRTSLRGTGFHEFIGGVDAAARFDIGKSFELKTALGYNRRPEEATSPVGLPATTSRPLRQTITGEAGLEKAIGPLRFGVTGAIARNTYGSADLVGGGVLSQADRNQTLYTAKLRGGYEVSPALLPFIELEAGRRNYDLRLDSNGYARSANRLGARAGVEFDRGEKLNGEIAAGIISENFDDARLGSLSAFAIDGAVNWSPMRGTTVTLTGSTEIEGTTTAGESGSVLYATSLGISRQIRAQLTADAVLGASFRRYATTGDSDRTLSAEARLTYWLNRYAGLTGRARHEATTSSIAGRGSRTTSVFLGLTMQR